MLSASLPIANQSQDPDFTDPCPKRVVQGVVPKESCPRGYARGVLRTVARSMADCLDVVRLSPNAQFVDASCAP